MQIMLSVWNFNYISINHKSIGILLIAVLEGLCFQPHTLIKEEHSSKSSYKIFYKNTLIILRRFVVGYPIEANNGGRTKCRTSQESPLTSYSSLAIR